MIGAAVSKAGMAPLLAPGIIKTTTFIVISPILGMLLSNIVIAWIVTIPASGAIAALAWLIGGLIR